MKANDWKGTEEVALIGDVRVEAIDVVILQGEPTKMEDLDGKNGFGLRW